MKKKGVHVVLIGSDDSVFSNQAASDTLKRHVCYGRNIEYRCPGSRLSLVISTCSASAKRFQCENVVFIPVRGGRVKLLFSYYRMLTKLYRECPIDVVGTQTIFDAAWAALVFKRIYGPPVIGQIHFDLFNSYARQDVLGAGIKGHIAMTLGLKSLKRMFSVRVVSNFLKDKILADKLATTVRVIPVPVSIKDTTSTQDNKKNLIGNPRNVLFVGRLVRAKNLDDWLRVASVVAAKAHDVVFNIVGDGPLRKTMENNAKRIGIGERVQFHGNVPNEKLSHFYNETDVLLMTSHYEGFGRVLVESYTCGTPAVCTRISGPVDIIVHGSTGFLHEPGDIQAMAESILILLGDDELKHRMGEEGRKLVKDRFDSERLTSDWMALLLEATETINEKGMLPLKATFKRWSRISQDRSSLLRSLEYERLCGLPLSGLTLDIGGGNNAGYLSMLNIDGTFVSINIDSTINPSIVADLNHPLPIISRSCDNVICFNTLEHIFNDKQLLREIMRVLKSGGRLHLTVPFLYKVHGSPFDYHRHTAQWWRETLLDAGVDENSLIIEPLIWSPYTSALSLVNSKSRTKRLLEKLIMLGAVIKQARWYSMERLPLSVARIYNEYALGFYITGVHH